MVADQQSHFSNKHNLISFTEEGAGVYSEQFYGPNGLLLLQQTLNDVPSSSFKEKFAFEEKMMMTDEKRYFLKPFCD